MSELKPETWIRTIRALSSTAASQQFDETRILLVCVTDAEAEFVQQLDQCFAGGDAPPFPSSEYQTAIRSLPSAHLLRSARTFDAAVLDTLLRQQSYFALPIRKRKDAKSFSARVSVGRARNNDIVLRHPTVSKFQAWFECDDNLVYSLGVAGNTTNTTLINGTDAERTLQPLTEGDALHFGDIRTLFVSAITFWQALRRRASISP